jgi:DNA repair exonuclease SbcCD ATPase subunit
MSLSNDNKMKESNNIDEKKDEINKNLYVKFITLKNEFIKERQKISLLEKENKSLKEENQKKDESIIELKDQLKKYHDVINDKSNSNFFTKLFNDINISDIKNEFSINKLTTENSDLKEQILNLNTELNSTKEKLEKINSELSQQKSNFEKEKTKYETQLNNYIKENEISKNKLIEYEKSNFNLIQTINAFKNDRKYIEENITKLKKEIKQKNEDFDKLFKEQENIINNNTEYKQKINNLKQIINQYKKAIDNTTDIKEDYIFIGKIIPNTHYNNIININNDANIDIFLNMENKIKNNQENYSNIKIIFNFNLKKIKIFVENKNPINIEAKDIIDIVENLHIEGQIKIFYKIKENVFDYLCQFTKKEADYIIHFYKELKNNDEHIDPALYAAYLGTQ